MQVAASDQLTQTQPDAFYKIKLTKRSDLVALLDGLNANANLYLLNSAGSQVNLTGSVPAKSENTGDASEYINIRAMVSGGTETLPAGTYYLKVSLASGVTETTNFSLAVRINFATGSDFFSEDAIANTLYHQVVTNFVPSATPTVILGAGSLGNFDLSTSGDIDNDGDEDVIITDGSTPKQIGIWYLNSSYAYVTSALLSNTLPLNHDIVGLGDFNEDGKTDIVLYDYTTNASNRLKVWYMDNTTRLGTDNLPLSNPDFLPYPPTYVYNGVDDFNKDGYPDIVSIYSYSVGVSGLIHSRVNFFKNNELIGRAGEIINTWTAAANMSGIGDFDGDSFPDLLHIDGTSGKIYFHLVSSNLELKKTHEISYGTGYRIRPARRVTPTSYIDLDFNSSATGSTGISLGTPLTGTATVTDVLNNVSDTSDMYYFDLTNDQSTISFNLTGANVNWNVRRGSPTGTSIGSGTGNVSTSYSSQPNDRYYVVLTPNTSGNLPYTLAVGLTSSTNNTVTNVDSVVAGNAGSNPREMTRLGAQDFIFVADTDEYGTEPVVMRTSGTGAISSYQVIDIVPGPEGSNPSDLEYVANGGTHQTFLVASDADGDRELYAVGYQASPNAANTPFAVKIDLKEGASSNPTNLTAVGTMLYFAADTTGYGVEPLVAQASNTAAGPGAISVSYSLLADIAPGAGSSYPEQFIPLTVNSVSEVAFIAESPTAVGREVFAAAAGSVVRDTTPTVINIEPETDGTTVNSSNPTELINAGTSQAYAVATTAAAGNEVFSIATSGATPTVTAVEVVSGTSGSAPSELTYVSEVGATSPAPVVYFAATDSTDDRELRQIKMSTPTTVGKIDVLSGTDSSNPTNLYAVPLDAHGTAGSRTGWLYFSAERAVGDVEAHRIGDANATSAALVGAAQINGSASADAYGYYYDETDGKLFFAASNQSNGKNFEPYYTTPHTNSAAATIEIRNNTPNLGSNPSGFFALPRSGAKSLLMFGAGNTEYGQEPYYVDTNASLPNFTRPGDLNKQPNGNAFSEVVEVSSNRVAVGPGEQGTVLWLSTADTGAGTNALTYTYGGSSLYDPHNLVVQGSSVYFIAYEEGQGYELYRLDNAAGSAAVTRLTDIVTGEGSSNIANLAADKGGTWVYFSGTDASGNHGLYRVSSGTTSAGITSGSALQTFGNNVAEPITQLQAVDDLWSDQSGNQNGIIFLAYNTNKSRQDVYFYDGSTLTAALGSAQAVDGRDLDNEKIFGRSLYGTDYEERTNYLTLGYGRLESYGIAGNAWGDVNTGQGFFPKVAVTSNFPVFFVNGLPFYSHAALTGQNRRMTQLPAAVKDNGGSVDSVVIPFYNDFVISKNALVGATYNQLRTFEQTGGYSQCGSSGLYPNANYSVATGWEPFVKFFGDAGFTKIPGSVSTDRIDEMYVSDSYAGIPHLIVGNYVAFNYQEDEFGRIRARSCFIYNPDENDNKDINKTSVDPTNKDAVGPVTEAQATLGSGAHFFRSLNNEYITFLADNGSGTEQLYSIKTDYRNGIGGAWQSNYTISQPLTSVAEFSGDFVVKDNQVYFFARTSSTAPWQVYSSSGEGVSVRTSHSSTQIPSNLQKAGDRITYSLFDTTTRQATLVVLQ